jgi:DNA-binding response OmpR family regulator
MSQNQPAELHKSEIVIVDDSAANLKFLSDLLTADGYTVRPASNGELTLRSIRAKQPLLILLDVRMPGMDGYEVYRQLKADETTRGIPVIFISAFDDESSKVTGFQMGGVDFISKPFQKEEVLARVKTHLSIFSASKKNYLKTTIFVIFRYFSFDYFYFTKFEKSTFFTLPENSGLKGKVDFSAFSLQGRGEKAEKLFLELNLVK